jgi:hypothetical protein
VPFAFNADLHSGPTPLGLGASDAAYAIEANLRHISTPQVFILINKALDSSETVSKRLYTTSCSMDNLHLALTLVQRVFQVQTFSALRANITSTSTRTVSLLAKDSQVTKVTVRALRSIFRLFVSHLTRPRTLQHYSDLRKEDYHASLLQPNCRCKLHTALMAQARYYMKTTNILPPVSRFNATIMQRNSWYISSSSGANSAPNPFHSEGFLLSPTSSFPFIDLEFLERLILHSK